MEQIVFVTASVYNNNNNNKILINKANTRGELRKYLTETKSHLPNCFAWKGYKQKAVCQSRIFSWQNFVLSSYQPLKFTNFNIGSSLLNSFVVKRRRSRHLLYFPDAAGISPTLVLNQNAKAKETRSVFPFKIWTSEAAKVVQAGRYYLWVCEQFSES